MIGYFKEKFRKHKLKREFKEYGYRIETFEVDGMGKVEYAQWLHPFDKPKEITSSNVNFYKKLSREGGFIVDIGAHTGDTTVPMALAVGKKGLVLGLEPNKYVFEILRKNSDLNKDKTHIIPLCFAATDEEGTFTFNYSDASFCNGGYLDQIEYKNHRHNFELKVKGRNLEKYLIENHSDDLPRLDLIKIDAEGYDKEILKTMPNIIKKYQPNLMIECYKRLSDEERNELFDIVDGYGYDLFYLENFEDEGEQIRIERGDMNRQKHFEMLALAKKHE